MKGFRTFKAFFIRNEIGEISSAISSAWQAVKATASISAISSLLIGGFDSFKQYKQNGEVDWKKTGQRTAMIFTTTLVFGVALGLGPKFIMKGCACDDPQVSQVQQSEKSVTEKSVTKGIDNPRTRLPRTNGKWEGETDNGKWYSDNNAVLEVTGGKPVEFKNSRPDFSQLKFKEGQLNGTDSDFKLVYEKLMKSKGFNSRNQAKNWLREKGLTPHHFDIKTIQLIPTKLHKNVPHIGSASDLRGGY